MLFLRSERSSLLVPSALFILPMPGDVCVMRVPVIALLSDSVSLGRRSLGQRPFG